MRSFKMSILVIDDDPRIMDLMEHILDLEGYRVIKAAGGIAGLAAAANQSPDLIILDIQMPDIDGYAVCSQIRETSQVPIIMVSARDEDQDKIKGLECGADDYVTKPFCVQELTARVKTVLRRAKYADQPVQSEFRLGPLVMDFAKHRVQSGGTDVNLTATEFRLVSYLARNAGRVVTPDQILAKVWGKEYMGDHHLLRVNMARLRQKISDNNKNHQIIATRPGLGYMMAEPDQPDNAPRQLRLKYLEDAMAVG
ncbi:MAG: response regulator transcription factor [Dehalococcoidia bacterium]|nr:response regulator transcription factor [Dehalococcoidia bacterium]